MNIMVCPHDGRPVNLRYILDRNTYGRIFTGCTISIYCLGINTLRFPGERGEMARLAAESRAVGTRKAHDMVIKAYKMFCQANGFNIMRMSKKSILKFIYQADQDRKSHGFISNVSFLFLLNLGYIG